MCDNSLLFDDWKICLVVRLWTPSPKDSSRCMSVAFKHQYSFAPLSSKPPMTCFESGKGHGTKHRVKPNTPLSRTFPFTQSPSHLFWCSVTYCGGGSEVERKCVQGRWWHIDILRPTHPGAQVHLIYTHCWCWAWKWQLCLSGTSSDTYAALCTTLGQA